MEFSTLLKLEPSFIERMFGTTKADKERARYQGDLQRFNESDLSDLADQYGVEVKETGRGKLNRGKIQSEISNAKDIKDLTTQLRALGGTGSVEGLDAGSIGSLIRDQRNQNTIETTQTAQAVAYNSPTARDERRIRDQRYYDNQKLQIEDRIERRENRSQELEYQKMRDRKEDMRYNEQMERLDRKDRKMAMQSLAAGLASLGAAFAL